MTRKQALYPAAISLAVLVALASATARADTQPSTSINNGGMEGPYAAVNVASSSKASISGVLPPWWTDDSGWADVTVTYSERKTDVHEGKSALQVDYKSKRAGECQLYHYVPQIVTGHKYTLTVWLEGDGKTPVDVYLRQPGAPYTVYGTVRATPGAAWTKVTTDAVATNTSPALFYIRPSQPMTLAADDASFTDDGIAGK